MNKILSKISIFIILFINTIIIICLLIGVSPQVTLSGVVNNTQYPKFGFNSILSGEYQSTFDKYFSENFPFRSYFIN